MTYEKRQTVVAWGTVAGLVMFLALIVGLAFWSRQNASATLRGCTEKGTKGNDAMVGTKRRDVMCGLEGNDYEMGNGRADRIRGGAGADKLVGNQGSDVLRGNSGNDRFFAVDSRVDHVIGGLGVDTCYVDRIDIVNGCEHKHVGASTSGMAATANVAYGATSLALDTTPTPTPSGGGGGGTGTPTGNGTPPTSPPVGCDGVPTGPPPTVPPPPC